MEPIGNQLNLKLVIFAIFFKILKKINNNDLFKLIEAIVYKLGLKYRHNKLKIRNFLIANPSRLLGFEQLKNPIEPKSISWGLIIHCFNISSDCFHCKTFIPISEYITRRLLISVGHEVSPSFWFRSVLFVISLNWAEIASCCSVVNSAAIKGYDDIVGTDFM